MLQRYCYGGVPHSLPFAYCEGELLSLGDFKDRVRTMTEIHCPMSEGYSKTFDYIEVKELTSRYFLASPVKNLVVLGLIGHDHLFQDEAAGRQVIEQGGTSFVPEEFIQEAPRPVTQLWNVLTELWGAEPRITLQIAQIFEDRFFNPFDKSWVLTFSKVR